MFLQKRTKLVLPLSEKCLEAKREQNQYFYWQKYQNCNFVFKMFKMIFKLHFTEEYNPFLISIMKMQSEIFATCKHVKKFRLHATLLCK